MTRILWTILSFLLCNMLLAQPYGNEWIVHGRQYWKFKVASEGIFRIDSTALANSGFPVTTVDPREIQLFNREKQIPIYVQGESDGVFNGTDMIEFKAEKNDAWLDAAMWPSLDDRNNPYYSLFNDTIYYYLTWNAEPQSLRVAVYQNTNILGHVPRSWFISEGVYSPAFRYQRGLREPLGATSSFMVRGEGFFHPSEAVANGTDIDVNYSVTSKGAYQQPDAPLAQCRVVFAGVNNPGGQFCPDHHTQIKYGPSFTLAVDTLFLGYDLIRTDFEFPASNIGTNNTAIRMSILHDQDACSALGSNYVDRQNMSFIRLRYARLWNMGGVNNLHLWLPDETPDSLAYIKFNGFSGVPLIYADGDSVRRIEPFPMQGFYHALIPPNTLADTTHLFMYSTAQVDTIAQLQLVNGTGYFTDLSQINTDPEMLIVTHHSLMNAAMQYASYREMSPKNPMNTLVVDVEELYDQFGGGIPKHPLSIRRFAEFALEQWAIPPGSLFLIGKSVQAPKVDGIAGHRVDPVAYAKCLVPTYGYPPSDVCLTLGLASDPAVQALSTGRLSAQSGSEVLAYLQKVQEFEGFSEPEAWMKNILHFRGGITPGEFLTFNAYLNAYAQIAEDTCFAGRVTKFQKNSGSILGQAPADSVRRFIEDEGVTLMTFFAHASGGGFDITIDNPVNYEWHGKYPAILGNSCYTGNIHLVTEESASELFVLVPNKGAIAFMASVDIGVASTLFGYTSDWYRSFSSINYGKGIGEHLRYATAQQLAGTPTQLQLGNAHTFTLHGDPAIILHSWPEPDFDIAPSDLSYSPTPVTADVDTFQMRAVVRNIGKGVDRMANVVLNRRLVEENLDLQPVVRQVDASVFSSEVEFDVPLLADQGGQGSNHMEVRVDLDPDEIPEIEDLMNNTATDDLLITSGEIFPVVPYEYGVIPHTAPTLHASTGDPFAPSRAYRFQIDTTDLFNSPIMEQTVINAPGGVVSWDPMQIFSLNASVDSTVYFWRCSPDSTATEPFKWRESSFQYITDRWGWGQAHFFQFKKDDFSNVIYDRPARQFRFNDAPRNIRAQVLGGSGLICTYFIDLDFIAGQGCGGTPALHVAVIDPNTFVPWRTRLFGQNPNNAFGNVNDEGQPCQPSDPKAYFSYWQNNGPQLAGLQDLLDNHVPVGAHVLVYSYVRLNKAAIDTLAPGLYGSLNGLGLTEFEQANDAVPYIGFVTKGAPSSAQEVVGDSSTAYVELSAWVNSLGIAGGIKAPIAGPVSEWKAAYWDELPNDIRDSVKIEIHGITAQGAEVSLFSRSGSADSIPVLELAPILDAAVYPYARFEAMLLNDSVADPLPSQMQRWQFLTGPAPECAIDPPTAYFNDLNGLFEGQQGRVAVAVRNISDFDMDSLLIDAWLVAPNGVRTTVHHRRNEPLPAGAFVLDTIHLQSGLMGGGNTLIIEANPIDSTTGVYDQIEQYHFNNIAQLRFDVDEDRENPLVDVTFDGIHILDGDIVSARPEIMITLDDENPILLLNSQADTANFKIFLTEPGGGQRRIYFNVGGMEQMRFIPTTGAENVSHIEYRPILAQDGIHQLTVQAKDISNNTSGDNDLQIRFEVINRPTITEVLNYPNPFTTNTRFVFTVTGMEPPTAMRIQIMTISGRVVREIAMHELGPIHVGRNISEYGWDGTDQFGDRLARGVYLYRVMANLHGEAMEVRDSGASPYFTKGFGKMYLLR